jgi:hypothetical protein
MFPEVVECTLADEDAVEIGATGAIYEWVKLD